MSSKSVRSLRLVPTSLGVALLVAGCASVEPTTERFVVPPLGSTWTVAQRTTGSFGSGELQLLTTRGEMTWKDQRVATYATPRSSMLVNTDDGAYVAVIAADGKQLASWEPRWGFDFPLFVGKTWRRSYQYTLTATNKTIAYEVTCRVDSYGNTSVPAGTFKAFKISCLNTISTEETFWFSPELGINVKVNQTRLVGNPSGAGTNDVELASQEIRK